MKIFDCTTFFEEHLMMDLRFNILNEHVSKFIVVESIYSHSGKKKRLNFNIDDYPKFKDRIKYIVIDKEPENLIKDITKAFVRGKNQAEAGFGLGLSICYKVISAHGGKLLIKNNPNGGASFTLCIPKEK